MSVGPCQTRETAVVFRCIVSGRTSKKTPLPAVPLLRVNSLVTQYPASTGLPSDIVATFPGWVSGGPLGIVG
jgi:hypothetical protein